MSRNADNDPNAPILRVVRHIAVHFVYLALSVALYFLMAELGLDLNIQLYFLGVLLTPAGVWLAVLAFRRLSSRRAGGGAEES